MKLQIDFYSKTEVAFDIDDTNSDDESPFPDTQAYDLFLFAAHTLRQLSNLGDHLVAKCLDGFLVEQGNYEQLLPQRYHIADPYTLLHYRKQHIIREVRRRSGNDGVKILSLNKALDIERGSINPNLIQAMDDIVSARPQIVPHRGARGKKSFVLTTEPRFRVDLHGMGIFSLDSNYFVFHSVISLARFLMLEHRHRPEFLGKIHKAGTTCANLHFATKIQPAQDALAVMVL